MLCKWLKKVALLPLFLLMGIDASSGWDDGGAGNGNATLGGNWGSDDDEGDPGTDSIDDLFSPEEIAARRESIAAAKAEEVQRAELAQEGQAVEDTAQTAEEVKNEVPETYADFVIPESMAMDKDMLEVALPLFKEAGLTQELAQKFINLEAQLAERRVQQVVNQIQSWADAAKADTEIGGDNFSANASIARRALNTFGTPELKTILDQTGLGNHPEIIRMMFRLGKSMREDSIVLPGSRPGDKKSIEDRLYGAG